MGVPIRWLRWGCSDRGLTYPNPLSILSKATVWLKAALENGKELPPLSWRSCQKTYSLMKPSSLPKRFSSFDQVRVPYNDRRVLLLTWDCLRVRILQQGIATPSSPFSNWKFTAHYPTWWLLRCALCISHRTQSRYIPVPAWLGNRIRRSRDWDSKAVSLLNPKPCWDGSSSQQHSTLNRSPRHTPSWTPLSSWWSTASLFVWAPQHSFFATHRYSWACTCSYRSSSCHLRHGSLTQRGPLPRIFSTHAFRDAAPQTTTRRLLTWKVQATICRWWLSW